MPRGTRLEVPGIPMHITHRGVNRAAVFIDDIDRTIYLRLVGQSVLKQEVSLHAYVLMSNHVHLLLSSTRAGAVSRALRNATQCYVQCFNQRHGRTGTLWEGRFKSCLVDCDRYLLSVIRYIELNPVRAMLVAHPVEFEWASIHEHLALRQDGLVIPHDTFQALGSTRAQRAARYAEWLMQTVSDDELDDIRRHARKQRALGDPGFREMVERTLNRPATCRGRGRPPCASST